MTPRRSIVEQRALSLFEKGACMSKLDLARAVPCDQRTAQRILARIHEMGCVSVVAWAQVYRHWVPVYKAGQSEDCPKPTRGRNED